MSPRCTRAKMHPRLINGTRLPWLASQTIHPYSDFLLHDMGPELDSHYTSGLAMGCEWRTTPLWGSGCNTKSTNTPISCTTGGPGNLKEAILWHGGEGAVSREIFKNMPREERDALIRFSRIIVTEHRSKSYEKQIFTTFYSYAWQRFFRRCRISDGSGACYDADKYIESDVVRWPDGRVFVRDQKRRIMLKPYVLLQTAGKFNYYDDEQLGLDDQDNVANSGFEIPYAILGSRGGLSTS